MAGSNYKKNFQEFVFWQLPGASPLSARGRHGYGITVFPRCAPQTASDGAVTSLIIVGISATVLIWLLNGQISAEQYRWLSAQVQSHPGIRDRVSDFLTDDGSISRGELRALKEQTEPQSD